MLVVDVHQVDRANGRYVSKVVDREDHRGRIGRYTFRPLLFLGHGHRTRLHPDHANGLEVVDPVSKFRHQRWFQRAETDLLTTNIDNRRVLLG